jgi:hypothetical protein
MSGLECLLLPVVFVGVVLVGAVLFAGIWVVGRWAARRRISGFAEADRAVARALGFTEHPADAEGRCWFTGSHDGRAVAFCHSLRFVRRGGGNHNLDILRIVVQRSDRPEVEGAVGIEELAARYAAPGMVAPLLVYEELGAKHSAEQVRALLDRLCAPV